MINCNFFHELLEIREKSIQKPLEKNVWSQFIPRPQTIKKLFNSQKKHLKSFQKVKKKQLMSKKQRKHNQNQKNQNKNKNRSLITPWRSEEIQMHELRTAKLDLTAEVGELKLQCDAFQDTIIQGGSICSFAFDWDDFGAQTKIGPSHFIENLIIVISQLSERNLSESCDNDKQFSLQDSQRIQLENEVDEWKRKYQFNCFFRFPISFTSKDVLKGSRGCFGTFLPLCILRLTPPRDQTKRDWHEKAKTMLKPREKKLEAEIHLINFAIP